ncbi:GGDEF domain-containing protein [Arenimonas oryziterrae]|uniref:diguanylate cyclase n=1 Tax=Arenimonas oryziterrae DSM 21050 = YC6267 TaxID=1121015 RepID=A0A091ATI1_9GAMM|nr:sensor domain-containing diguanylate cyclase [Arenimonas oryziterrae]KFN42457.1 hypothetical protein N789_13960 [Arenimonas oryziterrae DSM 21050 = YC6267]
MAVELRIDEAAALRQLMTLNRIARIAVQDLALQPMLQRIVDALKEEFGWEFVACATIDRERDEFVCEAVAGALESEVKVGYRRALGTGVVGQCASTGVTMDIDDARNHPAVIDTLHGTGSELCVPVVHNGEVLAVLNAESRRIGAFRGQRALLETVADQIAGILRAANLFGQLQRANAQLREAYAVLEDLSQNDSLTGVGNRRSFDGWIAQAIDDAAVTHTSLALLLIDIDHFKAFNDGYGHLAGDACLQQVAGLLAYVLEDGDALLARYGGEEFVVILAGAGVEEAARLAERLRLAVEARDIAHRHVGAGRVTISVGVAGCVPAPGATADALIAPADAALYQAKHAGRNRVAIASA